MTGSRSLKFAAILLASTTPALGQNSTDAASDQNDSQATPHVEEVVVTAQRRSEKLTDVPIAITAISGDKLQPGGITDLDNLTKVVPGLLIDRYGAHSQATIRGIGTLVTGTSADPAVAIYVDGVYQPSAMGDIFDLPNVDQIEVLKGPQGTLFGRNSTGGAILVQTQQPSFNTTGRVIASYGNFNELALSAYGNTALSDTVAVNLSAYYRHSDGWIHDLKTGDLRNAQHSLDIRGKILYKPTENFDLTFVANYNDSSDPTGGAQAVINANSAGTPLPGSFPVATQRNTLSHQIVPVVTAETGQYSVVGNLDMSFAALKFITAYRSENDRQNVDLDSTYAFVQDVRFLQRWRTFTQEVTLTSPSDQDFTWVAGIYYFHQIATLPQYILNGTPSLNSRLTTSAISGFADGTYKLGDFSMFAGLRYSPETKWYDYGAGTSPYSVHASNSFGQLTPRAGIKYALDSSSNLYVSYNRGFKSGTFNTTSAATTPVKAETVNAYEVGYKTSQSIFALNTSFFYSRYENIQLTAHDYTQGVTRLLNAAEAEIYGADVDANISVTDRFDVRLAAAYTHGNYTSFPGAVVFEPKPGGQSGNTTVTIDASGSQMLRAPEFTFSGTATYRVPVGEGLIELSVTPYVSSKVNYSFDERLQQSSYATVDASIDYLPNEHLRISLYGRNLTDTDYATFMNESSVRDGITYARPLTFGISAGYQF